jgi:hypothetical protein
MNETKDTDLCRDAATWGKRWPTVRCRVRPRGLGRFDQVSHFDAESRDPARRPNARTSLGIAAVFPAGVRRRHPARHCLTTAHNRKHRGRHRHSCARYVHVGARGLARAPFSRKRSAPYHSGGSSAGLARCRGRGHCRLRGRGVLSELRDHAGCRLGEWSIVRWAGRAESG